MFEWPEAVSSIGVKSLVCSLMALGRDGVLPGARNVAGGIYGVPGAEVEPPSVIAVPLEYLRLRCCFSTIPRMITAVL